MSLSYESKCFAKNILWRGIFCSQIKESIHLLASRKKNVYHFSLVWLDYRSLFDNCSLSKNLLLLNFKQLWDLFQAFFFTYLENLWHPMPGRMIPWQYHLIYSVSIQIFWIWLLRIPFQVPKILGMIFF